MSFKLIVSIVPHDSGDFITSAANSAGAGGGTIIMGKGTAENGILQLLGLGDSAKDITYNLVSAEIEQKVRNAIVAACDEKKAYFGVYLQLMLENLLKQVINLQIRQKILFQQEKVLWLIIIR